MSPDDLAEHIGHGFDVGARTALVATIGVLAKHPRRNRRALKTVRALLARFDIVVMGQ